MRITSFAPSITQPTYAVSSAPQGTFGASTPMIRSFAPAATETQRSGGLPTSRQFLAGVTALLTSVSLSGCGEETAAQLAKSLEKKAEAAETALASTFKTSVGVDGLETTVGDSIATGLGSLAPKAVGTATGGGSTVVGQVVNGSLNQPLPACKFGDKIPPNVDTNPATSVEWSLIGLSGRQGCIARWKIKVPKDPQLQGLDFQVNGYQAGTVVATNPSTGGSCARVTEWFNLRETLKEEKTKEGPLSAENQEIYSAAGGYKPVEKEAIEALGMEPVCDAIAKGLPEARRENVRKAIPAAMALYDQYNQALANFFGF